MLVARDEERRAIERLLEAARDGVGGGLLLRGDPGMGKSVLLATACDQASDMRVLRATCVEAETPLAYSVLHQLVRPLLDSLDRLPPPQRQALATALGLELGTAPDRFLISLSLGYPSFEDQISILEREEHSNPLDEIQASVHLDDIVEL